MRIAIAQINPTLGAFEENRKKILEQVFTASEKGAELVVFPECALTGYHPFDLLEQVDWVKSQEKELRTLETKIPKGVAVLVGLITRNPSAKGKPYYNSAALLLRGKKTQLFHKKLLPTGDVFDEARYIQPSKSDRNEFSFKGKKFLLTICEDIWAWPDKKGKTPYKENPLTKKGRKTYDLIINMSASPFFANKFELRKHVVSKTAQYFNSPMLYTNMVGAQDEIIYDGRSFLVNKKGIILFECQAFQEDLNLFQLETLKSWSPSPGKKSSVQELREALVLGIRDFCFKNQLQRAHLGVSGGIDSAVVACLAVDALGPQNVDGIVLPGPYSSPESASLGKSLCENLHVGCHEISISNIYSNVVSSLEKTFLSEDFSVAHENLQARLRGLVLMAFSNSKNSLLLTTGNKSEYATGYSTLYGDMCGGLAPLGDLTKKQVYEIAKLYNAEHELIPQKIITRAPTAELRENQRDQDTLPPYEDLDKSVVRIVEQRQSPKTKTDFWLLSQISKTEFKRWQAAPILKISSRSFGRGRRWPITFKGISKKT